jgi:DNA-directed RNA polymerase specialized sigma subunit
VRLDQLRHLETEIEILKEQIEKAETAVVTDVVEGSDDSFPYEKRKFVIYGIEDRKTERLRRRLTRKIEELTAARGAMLEFIEAVEDSEMRQILILRYIDGLTWRQVARKMGRAGDGSTERKKHDRFLAS